MFLLTTIYQKKFTTHAYVFWGNFLITNRKMQQFVKGAVKQNNNILEFPKMQNAPFECMGWQNNQALKQLNP